MREDFGDTIPFMTLPLRNTIGSVTRSLQMAGVCVALMFCGAASAGTVQVAVAANFSEPMKTIAAAFARDTGHKVSTSSGATGKLYAQIKNAAPFDVFLSADEATPAQLERDGIAVAGTRFTYAVGRLALWSASADLVDAKGEVLKSGNFNKIALASPKAAPYGAAAIETLNRLELLSALQPRFVMGESIGQAFSFVATGNAALGFVALSQVTQAGQLTSGSVWLVPATLHHPLRQDAVLLSRAQRNEAAVAFLSYLKTAPIQTVIRSYGYDI